MLKKIAALLAAASIFSTNALAAIVWNEADVIPADNAVSDGTFESRSGDIYNGTVETEKFKTEKGNVLQAASYAKLGLGELKDLVANSNKINIKFDYYTEAANQTLRCELRGIAASEITSADQNKYWTGWEYNTNNKMAAGQWHTFDASFDAAGLKKWYSDNGHQASNYVNSYIFVGVIGSNIIYIDNVEIKGEDTVTPLLDPTYTYNWTKNSDGSYAGTVMVEKATTESTALSIGYDFTKGTYKLSLSFMEDTGNKAKITRMWRPQTGNNTLISGVGTSSSYLYFNKEEETAPEQGVWTDAELQFNVSETENKDLLDKSTLKLNWQGRGPESGFKYDEGLNGNYKIYIKDVKLIKLPVTEDVITAEDASAAMGESAVVKAEGYIDTAVNATLSIVGQTLTGTASTTADNKYVTAQYTFDTSDIPSGEYPAVLNVTDIWGREKNLPITLSVVGPQDFKLTVDNMKWSENIVNIPETTVKFNGDTNYERYYDAKNDDDDTLFAKPVKDIIAEGSTAIKVSFTAKGDGTSNYTADTFLHFRTGSSNELVIKVPKADLNDGQVHSYSGILSLGEMQRYYLNGTKNVDRYDSKWMIMPRNEKSGGDVTFDNFVVQYLEKTNESSDTVAANLSVTNNESALFNGKSVFIVAEYADKNGSLEFTNMSFKNISFENSSLRDGAITDGIAQGETRNISFVINNYDSSKIYKAFLWDSFENIAPITEFATK